MTGEKKQSKRAENWRPALVLAAICAAAAFLIAAINGVTAPRILAREAAEKENALREMFPGLSSCEPAVLEAEAGSARGADRILDESGALIGYAVSVSPTGFKGAVELIIGFDAGGTIRAAALVSSEETPGIGDRVTDGAYLERFNGIGAAQGERPADGVDSVSGATVSSRAVKEGINDAALAVRELMGKDGETE